MLYGSFITIFTNELYKQVKCYTTVIVKLKCNI